MYFIAPTTAGETIMIFGEPKARSAVTLHRVRRNKTRARSMVRKTMFLGNYLAEFHLDHKSQPPLYHYAILHRYANTLVAWGRESSVPDLMRVGLELMERIEREGAGLEIAEQKTAEKARTSVEAAQPRRDEEDALKAIA
jgi:hypothetical protein